MVTVQKRHKVSYDVGVITVLVFGDQLNRSLSAFENVAPQTHRVLMVEAFEKITSRRWHAQRVHLYLSAMRHFAQDLEADGFHVDYRKATSMRRGIADHENTYAPSHIIATEPNSVTARRICDDCGIQMLPSNQFLCHPNEFEQFAATRKSMKMEDFYRWQRSRLGYLMDNGSPVGGQWNFDHDNREPPPKDGHDRWPVPPLNPFDEIDNAVLKELPDNVQGQLPHGQWATTRDAALLRLQFFVEQVLPMFGPHEDAMLSNNWHLAHSLLSPYLNIGLLMPGEVVDAVQRAFDEGNVPINSAEGFIRQIIGWREFVWNLYWKHMPEYKHMNALGANRQLPPLFSRSLSSEAPRTQMNCLSTTLDAIDHYGWAHHIQRLMVLGNFALLAEIQPQAFTDWMWDVFIDSAEWVMVPNVVGMSLYADGGIIATKPYASGGAYIDRMSDYCGDCVYDRTKRVGDNACPFTTLYWDFMMRHETQFVKNPRVSRQVYAARKLKDIDQVRERAQDILQLLDDGQL